MKAPEIHEALTNWYSAHGLSAVKFSTFAEPKNDPYPDYVVCYEAVFDPPTLEQPRVEIWVTTDGRVSLGLDTRARVAERLGIKNWLGSSAERFAGGHEPERMTLESLVAVLEAIAGGKLAVRVRTLPWLGLWSAKAAAPPEVVSTLTNAGYFSPRRWIEVLPEPRAGPSKDVVTFRPWT